MTQPQRIDLDNDVIHAMETCRAMRYLKPDPVPEELIERVIYAATRAPSPGNTQGWDFVVVRDRETKEQLRDLFLPPLEARWTEEDLRPDAPNSAMKRGILHMARGFADIPVIIFVCGIPCYPPQAPDEYYAWSTLLPAAQNLIVAARSLGLGTAYTQFQGPDSSRVKAILGIPAEARISNTIPLGWPDREFTPVNRRPVPDVIHWDRW